MSRAALTLMIYAIGFGSAGLGLMLVPNLILPLFGFAQTQEVWIHLIGLLMISLASYDIIAAQYEIEPIIQLSVPGRLFAGAAMIATWLLGMVGAGILFFAAVDILGALATMAALRGMMPARA
jgi:hypothetical protein